jgi:hypothetical protein
MTDIPLASSGSGAAFAILIVIYLAVIILTIASLWRCFTKAGHAGWKAIIPIYNLYIMLKIAGKPGWWLILLIIPIVNIVFLILTYVAFARSYGKGGGFAVGLILLSFIFFPILGFGSATYVGPGGSRGYDGGYGPPQGGGYGPPQGGGYGPPQGGGYGPPQGGGYGPPQGGGYGPPQG